MLHSFWATLYSYELQIANFPKENQRYWWVCKFALCAKKQSDVGMGHIWKSIAAHPYPRPGWVPPPPPTHTHTHTFTHTQNGLLDMHGLSENDSTEIHVRLDWVQCFLFKHHFIETTCIRNNHSPGADLAFFQGGGGGFDPTTIFFFFFAIFNPRKWCFPGIY